MEALQQATGLSPTVLAHALSPLTAEKGILTTDSPDSNLVNGELPLCLSLASSFSEPFTNTFYGTTVDPCNPAIFDKKRFHPLNCSR